MQTTIFHFLLLLSIYQVSSASADDEIEEDSGQEEIDFSKFEFDESKYNVTCYEYEKIQDPVDVEFFQGICSFSFDH